MDRALSVKPLGICARCADVLLIPFMDLLTGKKDRQHTHRWNNHHLKIEDVDHLNNDLMVYTKGDPEAKPCSHGAIAHTTPVSNWRNYIVIAPDQYIGIWHVGWISGSMVGVSRIPLQGPVRLLRGHGGACFFGVTLGGKRQIAVKQIGEGRIGDGSSNSKYPLL